ncbi:MAG: hypothetical protein MK100_04175 [Phycisphaerales bacterium]|nr:hypothetical protein [Phycisphaerales bacterium]
MRRVERVFIPKDALRADNTVMLIDEDSRAVSRTVKVGTQSIDGWREVTSGLSPGDRVITSDVAEGSIVQSSSEDL